MFVWHLHSVEETERAAQMLAEDIPVDGLTIALDGPLGAGKTAFVRGLARGLGLDVGQVASPTFVIANEYRVTAEGAEAGRCLIHVDYYRVEKEEELWSSGIDEFFGGDAVVAVEWANRYPGSLPADRLEVSMSRPGGERGLDFRELSMRATGEVAALVLSRWAQQLEAVSRHLEQE